MSELLESRWQETKSALLEGLQGNKKSVMSATLDNTKKYLAELTAGEEALSPFKIGLGYSGGGSTDKATATAALEGEAGKRLSIQILKQTVEAKTRKLSARWTFESAQDAQAQQGIDVEAEIMAALAQEITAENDQEVLASLRNLAGAAEADVQLQRLQEQLKVHSKHLLTLNLLVH